MTRRVLALVAVGLSASLAACGGSNPTGAPTVAVAPTATTASTAMAAPMPTAAPTAAPEAQPQAVIEKDLAFATYNGVTLTLDLYIPADPDGAPIVIEPWENFAERIAQEGAIAVIGKTGVEVPDAGDDAEARLSDHGAVIRAQAEQTACAILFARARAAELGSDDPVVAVGGWSQYGGVAAHVALFGGTLEERWDEFAATVGGPPRQVECAVADGSTHVDALVGLAGAYTLYVPAIDGRYGRSYQQQMYPEQQQFLASAIGAHPELTVRLIHGTGDVMIPMEDSVAFETALADAGYDVQLATFVGGHRNPPTELSLEIFKEVLGL